MSERFLALDQQLDQVCVTLEDMSRQVNLYEAKTLLSRLVDDAARGEVIIIAKDGKPMARLGPIGNTRKEPRQLGQLAETGKAVDWGRWWRNWKKADKEIEADFETSAARPFPAPGAKPKPKR